MCQCANVPICQLKYSITNLDSSTLLQFVVSHPFIWHISTPAHGTPAHRHTGTSAHRHTGTSAHRHTGTPAHRHISTPAHRHTGTPAHWHIGTSAHWHISTLVLKFPQTGN